MEGNPRVPAPIALEDEGPAVEFEVERVLGKRQGRGRAGAQYLVRWKGYGAHEDTWEPASHLANAKEKIAEFEARGQAVESV